MHAPGFDCPKKIISSPNLCSMSANAEQRAMQSQQAILESARREIERNGILGLRVADVAEGANCSITQIYRYFDDRNGLLARVLGDLYEDILTRTSAAYRTAVLAKEPLTVADLVEALPGVADSTSTSGQRMRLQILAASVTNEPLRLRLEEITRAEARNWDDGLDEIERRLAPGEKFDRRVFTMFLANFLPYYRQLLGEKGFTSEEFRQFLRDKMSG